MSSSLIPCAFHLYGRVKNINCSHGNSLCSCLKAIGDLNVWPLSLVKDFGFSWPRCIVKPLGKPVNEHLTGLCKRFYNYRLRITVQEGKKTV